MVRSTFNRSSVFAQYLFGIYPLFVQSMNVHILDMCHTYSEQDWSQIAACTVGVENGVCCTRRRTIPWEVLSEIVDGGKDYMTTQIAENGITWEMALAITEKRMEDIIKFPCSCALSVNGQVFHGIEGIEKYCQEQRDGSSPYILKRCHELPCMEQEGG